MCLCSHPCLQFSHVLSTLLAFFLLYSGQTDWVESWLLFFFADLCPQLDSILPQLLLPRRLNSTPRVPQSRPCSAPSPLKPGFHTSAQLPGWRFASPPQFCGSRLLSISTARPWQGRVPCAWPCREPPPPTSASNIPSQRHRQCWSWLVPTNGHCHQQLVVASPIFSFHPAVRSTNPPEYSQFTSGNG